MTVRNFIYDELAHTPFTILNNGKFLKPPLEENKEHRACDLLLFICHLIYWV